MKIVTKILLLLLILALANACEKEKQNSLNIPPFLYGIWKNVDGSDEIIFTLDRSNKIKVEKSLERGFTFKIHTMDVDTNYFFNTSSISFSEKNKKIKNTKLTLQLELKVGKSDTISIRKGSHIDENFNPVPFTYSKLIKIQDL
jgi:hypothetical protein